MSLPRRHRRKGPPRAALGGVGGRCPGVVPLLTIGGVSWGPARACGASALFSYSYGERIRGFSPYDVAHSSIFLDGSWRDGLLWERVLGDSIDKSLSLSRSTRSVD